MQRPARRDVAVWNETDVSAVNINLHLCSSQQIEEQLEVRREVQKSDKEKSERAPVPSPDSK